MPHELSDSQYTEFVRLQDFAAQYGGADGLRKKIDKLEKDGAGYRQAITDLEGKQVPDGAKVLTGDAVKRYEAFEALQKSPEELSAGAVLSADDKKEWEAFKASGVKAAEVQNIVKERDDLQAKDAQRTHRDTLAKVAKSMGWADEAAATMADMRSLDGATFEFKKEKAKDANGAEVEKEEPYVTVSGGQQVKFFDFAAQTDALKGIRTSAGEGERTDKTWVSQSTGGGKGGGYDPAKEGREMAEKQKASKGAENLAFT
jgi:hypothetical protein